MSKPHFSPDALDFLRDLAKHNNRDWFEAQRARFEGALRDPFVAFLLDLQPRLERVNEKLIVDAKPHGGSLARIHRDMRFVANGQPYKTALSAHFAHEDAKEGARPAFFLYVEPGHTRAGAGIRDPDATARKKLKRAIERDEDAWKKATQKVLDKGGALERFTLTLPLPDEAVTTARFLDDVVAAYRALDPFVRFVSAAVGLRA